MRRRQRTISLPMLILLGAMAGIVFLIYDQWSGDGDSSPSLSPPVTVMQVTPDEIAATSVPPDSTATVIPSSGSNTITNANIFIPSAGIYATVIRVYLNDGTWNVDNLGDNVGHLEGTDWLGGGPGNIVLSGHVELRDGRAGVFAQIEDLEMGALIELTQDDEVLQYNVTEIYRVEPDDISPIYPTTTDQLTLITCDEYDFFQNTYTERVIVVAERIG
jgi:LPXTG-site transpeptidase (sortase) family protein